VSNVAPPAGRLGLWGGFLDRLPAAEAVSFVQDIESAGIDTVWLQEYSGVDPFIRAALYLSATTRLSVALGVAVVYARDPEAMVAAASTLEEAFPGRFVLGMGVSHRHLVESRGHRFGPPIATMTAYLAAMDVASGERRLPLRVLGALGPKMVELAGAAADGAHTYFSPVAHTALARAVMGSERWLVPTQMVALTQRGSAWREGVRRYLGLCLGMPNYVRNLQRFGFTAADLESTSDALVDALVVPDDPQAWRARADEQYAAGADQVVLQLVPPPRAEVVHDWLTGRFRE
jgi:probable F420-dependent oxidoreductase